MIQTDSVIVAPERSTKAIGLWSKWHSRVARALVLCRNGLEEVDGPKDQTAIQAKTYGIQPFPKCFSIVSHTTRMVKWLMERLMWKENLARSLQLQTCFKASVLLQILGKFPLRYMK